MARQVHERTTPVEERLAVRTASLSSLRPTVGSLAAYLPLVVLAVVMAGCAVRIVAAERLTPHVDEAASVLAAHAVVERGVPVLPSGTVYFQGATLSYLLAPFVWLGFGGLEDLVVMRGVSVVAGTIAVYLVYRLGAAVTSDDRIGVLAALFVALDPLSVQWSGHVRMYGLLQVLTIAFTWLLVRAIRSPTLGVLGSLVVVFWAAIFTHIEVALLWPVLALAGLVAWRSWSGTTRWRWVWVLGLTACAPVALLVLNGLLGTASVNTGASATSSKIGFVGDHLLAPLALLQNFRTDLNLGLMLHMNNIVWYVPGILVAAGTLAAAWSWRRGGAEPSYRRQRTAVAILFACYWVPVLGVGVFSIAPKERYLLHVHLIGYVLLAAFIVRLGGAARFDRRARRWSVSLAAVMTLLLAIGLGWRLLDPVVHADHVAATEYIVEHRLPNEPVIAALPAVAGILLDDRDELYFLAGSENRSRAERLTRLTSAGLVDYWMGARAIVNAETLERLLRDNPGAWVVVDRDRLAAEWAYEGDIAETLGEWTEPVYEAAGGALVLRVPFERSAVARDTTPALSVLPLR